MSLNVQIDFAANVAKFDKSINKLEGRLGKFENKASSVGKGITSAFKFGGPILALGGLAAGMVAVINKAATMGDELQKASIRTGVAVEQLNGLTHAAKLSDVSATSLTRGLVRLGRVRFEQKDLLKSLGVKDSQNNYQAFLTVVDGLKAVKSESERSAIANKLFGVSYRELIPLLSQTSDGIKGLVAEGQALNPITTEMANQSAQYKDNLDRLDSLMSSFATTIGTEVLPEINNLIEGMLRLAGIDVKPQVNIKIKTTDIKGNPIDPKQQVRIIEGAISDLNGTLNELEKSKNQRKTGSGRSGANKSIIDENIRLIKAQISEYEKQSIIYKNLVTKGTTDTGGTGKGKGIDPTLNRILDSIKTKTELYKEQVKTLDNYLSKGKITQEQYNKAVAQAKDKYLTAKVGVKKYTESLKEQPTIMDQILQKSEEMFKNNQQLANQYVDSALTPFEKIKNEIEQIQTLQKQGFITSDVANTNIANLQQPTLDNVNSIATSLLPQDQQQSQSKIDKLKEQQQYLTEAQDAGIISLQRYSDLYDGLQEKIVGYQDGSIQRQEMFNQAMADTADMASNTLAQAFDDLFSGQKKGLDDYLKSFLKAISKIITKLLARLAIELAIKAISSYGSVTNAAAGNGNSLAGGLSSQQLQSKAITPSFNYLKQANGGAFNKGVQFFSKGGVFNRPTGFTHRDGLGVLGEAGPEVILPLSRDKSGRLGVKVQGSNKDQSNQGSSSVININVSANNSKDQQNLEQLARKIEGPVKRIIQSEQRPGGLLA